MEGVAGADNFPRPLHLAMVPWLAFGHFIPFLQLSIRLARKGFRISFISTPNNIRRLPKLPPDLTSGDSIAFVELPFPVVDGLEPGAECTSDLPSRDDGLLKKAFDLLASPFDRLFLSQKHPDFVVYDVLAHWTVDVCRRSGARLVLFSIYSARTLSFLCDDRLRKLAFGLPHADLFEDLPREYTELFVISDPSGISVGRRVFLAADGCEAIFPRTCEEYEGEDLRFLKKQSTPVIPVGLLPPENLEAPAGGDWERLILPWLDGKAAGTVVYVVFGSERRLSQVEVRELARGLELSGLKFLCVLSRPAWAEIGSDLALPHGFQASTRGRGLLHFGWVPQMHVLQHPAVGGCMFHAGWSTLIEAVGHGLPMVLLPFDEVQKSDAKVAVEKGLAVEVERVAGASDVTFRGEDIAAALRRAMDGEEGKRLKLKLREMKGIFSDRMLHERYLDGFVDFLRAGNSSKEELSSSNSNSPR